MNKFVKTMLTSLTIGALALGAAGCSEGAAGSTQVNLTKSLDAANVQNLAINSPSTKVHLSKASGDKVEIVLKGTFSGDEADKEKLLNAAVDGSNLTVKVEKSDSYVWKVNELQLDVQVPAKVYDKIQVETSGGDIGLDAFEAKQLVLNASSGDVQVAGYKGDAFNVETSSGTIDLSKMNGQGTLKSSSGDAMVAMEAVTQDLSIETSSGKAIVKMPETAAFRLEAETDVKDAKIDYPVVLQKQEGEKMEATAGNADAGAPLVKVKTSSGEFELSKAE